MMQLMSAEQSYFDHETTTRIIDYTVEVEGLRAPEEVLNRAPVVQRRVHPQIIEIRPAVAQ